MNVKRYTSADNHFPSAEPLANRTPEGQPPRLLDQVRARIRVKHYSYRTEQTYLDWITRYIKYFDKSHPCELSAAHVKRYLRALST